VVTVPRIKDGFTFASRGGCNHVEWARSMVDFSQGCLVELLQIHGSPGFAVFLWGDDHAGAPRRYGALRYWFDDT